MTVLDDSHDDGGETLTLTLSNAANGDCWGTATATGTIENSDPLPKALVARFGRTAALHVVEQVEERVNAPRGNPGFDGRAGRPADQPRNMGRDFALDFLQQLGGGGYGYTANATGTGRPMHGRRRRTTRGSATTAMTSTPADRTVNGVGLTPMNPGGMQAAAPGTWRTTGAWA